MLAVAIKHRIGSTISGGNIITEEMNWNLYQNIQIEKKLAKPLYFSSCTGTSSLVLSFYKRVTDSGLFLKALGDKVRAQENSKPCSRLS